MSMQNLILQDTWTAKFQLHVLAQICQTKQGLQSLSLPTSEQCSSHQNQKAENRDPE